MKATEIVFVGETSLLIRCAEHCLATGQRIVGVATTNLQIRAWAVQNECPVFPLDTQLADRLGEVGFDYVFSVGNFQLLSAGLIGRARKHSINFHDGPLPQYAGLNATCWALINREHHHSVTWHVMEDRPDSGSIVAAAEFGISDDETALSLNVKCYEAGFVAFVELWSRVLSNSLALAPQHGVRKYYGRTQRPRNNGTIDFRDSAEHIDALVRALHFGPYRNEFATAKLFDGQSVYLVGESTILSPSASYEPGQIVSKDATSITIATSTAPVRLAGLTTPDGRQTSLLSMPALAPGAHVKPLHSDLERHLEVLAKAAVAGEPAWRSAYEAMNRATLPYPILKPRLEAAPDKIFNLPCPASLHQGLAAILAWFARVRGETDVCVPCRLMSHDKALGEAAPWFSPWRPISISATLDLTLSELVAATGEALARLDQAAPVLCDLEARLGFDARQPALEQDAALAILIADHSVDAKSEAHVVAVLDPVSGAVRLRVRSDLFDTETSEVIAAQLASALAAFATESAIKVAELELRSLDELKLASSIRQQDGPLPETLLHEAIAAQAQGTPDRVAIRTRRTEISYSALNHRATRVARRLADLGVRPGVVVGVYMNRCPDVVTALLAILKTGAAYLPLDPALPTERLAFMIKDSQSLLVVTDRLSIKKATSAATPVVKIEDLVDDTEPTGIWKSPPVSGQDVAYLIYTSGSTGQPKGVAVPQRALSNFAVGMDERVPSDPAAVWLAVTSISFDISVLELLWTLSRGFTVALHGAEQDDPSFSLFYFSASSDSTSSSSYRLLMEGARFADAHGFEAVWTPERHFHDFGGAYPNPAVTSAALAVATTRIQIRAGSCVLPLHNPIRVAEDWSVIDVLSDGRTGLAFASGWQPNDFVLDPGAFRDRKQTMLTRLDQVQRLWSGEPVAFPGPNGELVNVRTVPRPVQKELPIWLTAAKSPETFEIAGRRGHNVLTHLLGMSLDEIHANIEIYRSAWREAGHAGQGRVTLMLHTFVAETDAEARALVREPLKRYLETALDLLREAAWTFPTFLQKSTLSGRSPADIFQDEPLTPAERDALLDHAFERYYSQSGLIGGHETCVAAAQKVAAAGVDEIACLIDFGVDTETVLQSLPRLKDVMEEVAGGSGIGPASVRDSLRWSKPTHLQLTPSMSSMLAAECGPGDTFPSLRAVMVGGEVFTPPLAATLRALAPNAKVLNMYGPTETTIWSTTWELGDVGAFVPLGAPIVNTTLRVAGPHGYEQPALVPGDLWIGGAGVSLGYWRRPELTADRFAPTDPSGETMYRTGDLVRRHRDGSLEFLGRLDHQVKIRGHRIELGEIESAIELHPDVSDAVVVAYPDATGAQRLTAYVVPRGNAPLDLTLLRTHLVARLPAVMIPDEIVSVEEMPLTPSGKTDRSALLAYKKSRPQSEAKPADALEHRIAQLWGESLDLETVGPTQNFFEIGGHSLLAVQVLRRMRAEISQKMGPTDLYRFPTVRTLASHLSGAGSEDLARDQGVDRAKARLNARTRATAKAADSAGST